MAPATPSGNRPGLRGICVVMAGGRGTRFWPLSRRDRPKQLLALASERSLLRETCDRLLPLVGPDRILVVTSGALAPAVAAELPELPPERIIAEPVGRNTAPCAVLGLGVAAGIDPDAPVALLPADHLIPDHEAFAAQLDRAFGLAAGGAPVVTFGIRPTRPETGYGYIEADRPAQAGQPWTGKAFVEKPDLETAAGYLAAGRHFWNSGIFIWNQEAFARLAAEHLAVTVGMLAPAVASFGTAGFLPALQEAYRQCPADSIDCAVMEKLVEFAVLPARIPMVGPRQLGRLGRNLPGPVRRQPRQGRPDPDRQRPQRGDGWRAVDRLAGSRGPDRGGHSRCLADRPQRRRPGD